MLHLLNLRAAGGNHTHINLHIERLQLDTVHFETASELGRRQGIQNFSKGKMALSKILIENSTYSRHALKKRLYEEGLKLPYCELELEDGICGQGTTWRGQTLSLILDHINGVSNDNRLENLRIICPNCNATLDTHCGKNKPHECAGCHEFKVLVYKDTKTCSGDCNLTVKQEEAVKRKGTSAKKKKLSVPAAEVKWGETVSDIQRDVEQMGWKEAANKRGISDNGLRKRFTSLGGDFAEVNMVRYDPALLVKLVEEGKNGREIALAIGCTQDIAYKRIRDNGLKTAGMK